MSTTIEPDPATINTDKEKKLEVEEGPSLLSLNKEVESYSTDASLIAEIDRDFHDVLKEFSGDPDLELFKIKYETIYNSLKESYENELRWIKKCKEHNHEIYGFSAKVQSALRQAQEDEGQADAFKRELDEKRKKIEEAKKKEQEFNEKKHQYKYDLQELSKSLEKGIDEILIQNEETLNNMRSYISDLNKQLTDSYGKLSTLRSQNEASMNELRELEDKNYRNKLEISNKNEQIQQIRQQAEKEEKRKKDMDKEMEKIKIRIDEAKTELQRKEGQTKEYKQSAEALLIKIQKKIKEKELIRDRLRMKANKKFSYEKDFESQQESLATVKKHIEDLSENIKKNKQKIDELSKTLITATKEDQIYAKKTNEIIQEKEEVLQKKERMQSDVDNLCQSVAEHKKLLESIEEEIDHKLKERSQTTKNLKKAEDDDHNLYGEITYVKNKLKKLQNQVRGYQIEAQKLNKTISQLEKEREKYGIEASQAHAKYYQTIEEVKIKNNMIAELQKKNAEVEAKLKHQQNLYEAVRSDRNLYSKNLLESQEEIAELSKKYKRMTHQSDQLKEQIKAKNADLIKQDFEFKKIFEENNKTKNEKNRIILNIQGTEKAIKNQESHISKLKFIITEAKNEKQKQEKDYEMVVNERDILGTQLIKRNQELSILYEKIKLSQSNLAKGEIYYRDKQGEHKSLQEQLVGLRKELTATIDQISCMDDLKNEINRLEKDLLSEKTKVKALEDELKIKMNVHRWRKLEATDQEAFEQILKIQTLQRRLIAKTEEVQEKENLIKEKEKLFMELKNILARQPGSEIHKQLEEYKESLKEKTNQMKKMMGELKNSQNQSDLLKFDINRIKIELNNMKIEYFNRKTNEDKDREISREKLSLAQQEVKNLRFNGEENAAEKDLIISNSPKKHA